MHLSKARGEHAAFVPSPGLPHLGVGGAIDDFSFPHPDDGGCWFGIVGVAGQVEGVSCSQADDGPPHNDWIIWRNCKETAQRRHGQLAGIQPTFLQLPVGCWDWSGTSQTL